MLIAFRYFVSIMSMELRHLRYFVTVAEELNVRRAAVRLHVSQPPLSRQIHDLEAEIGARLFSRHKRGVELTDAGRLFLGEARQILARTEQAIQIAQSAGRGEAGRLSLAYSAWACDPVIPWAIRRFRCRSPLVELQIRELPSHEQIEALLAKQLDVGYVGMRFPELNQELEFECMRRAALCVALPPDHPLALRRRLSLRSLAAEPFVSLPLTVPFYREAQLDLCRSAGFTPNIVQEANNAQSLLQLVSAGVGVTIVPDVLQRFLNIEVEFRPLPSSLPRFEFHAAWRRDNSSPTLRTFLAILREERQAAP